MSVRVFVDTNILVYAHDAGAGERHEIARDLIRRLWSERSGILSTQVIQEFYVNVRRKAARPIEPDEARRLIDDYLVWEVIVNDGKTILGALDIEQRFRISFWDALIVQAAKVGQAERIYSEDLNHGQLYDGVQVINPFSEPSSGSTEA